MGNIEQKYAEIFPELQKLSISIEDHLKEYLSGIQRIDRISARPKSIERFIAKSKKIEKEKLKYTKPLTQIQDQVGARIITYYLSDVNIIADYIHKYYEPVEEIDKQPKRHDAFSYLGKHFILFIPDELRTWSSSLQMPLFFELQIKTLFQHAWAENEHDLNYKTDDDLTIDDKRLIAFSAAQAWGADRVFDDLFNKYNKQQEGDKDTK
ncbi:MAG: RelA/SpoT domain-containing protein [Spirochaetes bacterium]|nr:RelA/SpoT domain-containing protein [Spirochaetota bacterium]